VVELQSRRGWCRFILLGMPFLRLLLLLGLVPLAAFAEPVRTAHVTAELISEESSVQPGGTVWVGLRLEMDPHWHTYWRFPGDSGLPTKVAWELPRGWKISEPHWPVPQRILLPPLVNYGFENSALIGFRLEVPPGARERQVLLKAKANWLVCKKECIPESAELNLNVSVSRGEARGNPWRNQFEQLREQQAQPLPQGAFLSMKMDGKRIGLEFDNSQDWLKGNVDFFPYTGQLIAGTEPPRLERRGGGGVVWMDKARPFLSSTPELAGILVVGSGPSRRVYELQVPFESATAAAISTASPDAPGLLLAALFAFLGGLLLNLMPCVFPVLGIKVMALVSQGGGDKWHARRHGNIYALGVLVSFWALTAALLAIRAAGQSVGWGFQLQQPGFVLALILLFSLLAANLAGFFSLGGRFMGLGSGLAAKEGASGSFFTGMLAVVVATPCTAPFMGTAIGVVLGQPAWAVFAVFTSLALGLAAPFVLLSYQPTLMKALPRPGAWMEKLKEFFAFPLAATVLWLLWVLGMQIGIDGLVVAAGGLLMIFFSIWLGRRLTGPFGRTAAWLALAVGCLIAVSSLRWGGEGGAGQEQGGWMPYSEATLAEALESGSPVFIDFTAAWCLTCQVNKSLVLDRTGMRNFFAEEGVTLIRADWTNHDPEITAALERHGRIGVPLYLAYPAGQKEARILPQILTDELVRVAFSNNQKQGE
jgi:DsbC/DsbD-like thiol-disulfide interchange protein/cytochrome c biogenesis protein CcdA